MTHRQTTLVPQQGNLNKDPDVLDRKVFHQLVRLLINDRADDWKDLLHRHDKWSADAEFCDTLYAYCCALLKKHIKRAAVFGDYRAVSDAPKKSLCAAEKFVKESDFSLAWQSLEADVDY